MRCGMFAILLLPGILPCAAQTIPRYAPVVVLRGEIAERSDSVCRNSVCVCHADISYLRFYGIPKPAQLAAINKQMRADASEVKCARQTRYATVEQRVTHASANYLSVIEDLMVLDWGQNGSCHGYHLIHTFKLTTGKEVHLSDVILPSSLPKLRLLWPDSLLQRNHRDDPHTASPSDGNRSREAVASKDDHQLLNSTIFMQDGHAYLDFGEFIFSCADGNFQPAEIPASFITDADLLNDLKVNEKQSRH